MTVLLPSKMSALYQFLINMDSFEAQMLKFDSESQQGSYL